MREPIDFDDIRIGDTVERVVEAKGETQILRGTVRNLRGDCIYLGDHDLGRRKEMSIGYASQWFLLDRPAPMGLTSTPTLGWIFHVQEFFDHRLGTWHLDGDLVRDTLNDTSLMVTKVTGFTPATAIPTAAVDELRKAEQGANASHEDAATRNYVRKGAINKFLATVDEAQS